MDKLEASQLAPLEKLMVEGEAILTKYGPGVADAALSLIRVEGLFLLACFGVGTLLFSVLGYYLIKISYDDDKFDTEPGAFVWAAGITSWVIALLNLCFGLTNFGLWLAIYDPKLYLLKQAMKAVGV